MLPSTLLPSTLLPSTLLPSTLLPLLPSASAVRVTPIASARLASAHAAGFASSVASTDGTLSSSWLVALSSIASWRMTCSHTASRRPVAVGAKKSGAGASAGCAPDRLAERDALAEPPSPTDSPPVFSSAPPARAAVPARAGLGAAVPKGECTLVKGDMAHVCTTAIIVSRAGSSSSRRMCDTRSRSSVALAVALWMSGSLARMSAPIPSLPSSFPTTLSCRYSLDVRSSSAAVRWSCARRSLMRAFSSSLAVRVAFHFAITAAGVRTCT